MTQQPFSRPGAIDLSGLKRPAGDNPGAAPVAAPAGGAPVGRSAYAMDVTEETFQTLLDASVTAPVVLLFYSASRVPESATMAQDVALVAEEYDGRFLAGLVDIDAAPTIAQAMQIPQVPLLLVVLDGRPAAQPIPGVLSLDEIRTLINQLAQGLTAQGVTGRHQPLHSAPVAGDAGEPQVDPRYAGAQAALANNDIDGAVAEYQRLVDANPADTEAAAGLAMARVLQRTQERRPADGARCGGRLARRRGCADPGRRPRPARRPRRRRLRPPGRAGPPYHRRRAQPRPRAPGLACSPPSATTTRGCCAVGRASPRRCSEAAVTTIVFCHAHPDDEASQTSGAMARASAQGDRVVVVFATNGEHGEVPADLADGETVAAYRRREADASARSPGSRPGGLARLRRLRHERLGPEPPRGLLPRRRPRRGRPPAGRHPRRGGRRRAGRLRLARQLRPPRPREGPPPRAPRRRPGSSGGRDCSSRP